MKIRVIYQISWRVFGCKAGEGKFPRYYRDEAHYKREREYDLIVIYGKLHMLFNEKKTRMISIELLSEKVEVEE